MCGGGDLKNPIAKFLVTEEGIRAQEGLRKMQTWDSGSLYDPTAQNVSLGFPNV